LDLLNTTFVVAYSDLRAEPESFVEKDGIKYATEESATDVDAKSPLILSGEAAEGDTLAIVTTLANAAGIVDGLPLAPITVRTSDGHTVERPLRAGLETAEWAHQRADVRPGLPPALAP